MLQLSARPRSLVVAKLNALARFANQLEAELAASRERELKLKGRVAQLERVLAQLPQPDSLRVKLGADDALLLEVPPAPGHTQPHSLRVRLEGCGFVLARILRAQTAATEGAAFKLGRIASPTQAQVEGWLQQNRVKRFTQDGRAVIDMEGAEL